MNDAKSPNDDAASEKIEPPTVAGQGDELDRGSGLGASGGGLGKTTGFWPEQPAIDDLKEAGADVDFDKSLGGDKPEN